MFIVLAATIANADEWVEMEIFAQHNRQFFKQYIDLENGIPTHDTIRRVMVLINPAVTFKEDANTAIDKTAVMNQNIIRKWALAILKRIDTILRKKYSLKGTLCDEFIPLRCFGSSFGNITVIINMFQKMLFRLSGTLIKSSCSCRK